MLTPRAYQANLQTHIAPRGGKEKKGKKGKEERTDQDGKGGPDFSPARCFHRVTPTTVQTMALLHSAALTTEEGEGKGEKRKNGRKDEGRWNGTRELG